MAAVFVTKHKPTLIATSDTNIAANVTELYKTDLAQLSTLSRFTDTPITNDEELAKAKETVFTGFMEARQSNYNTTINPTSNPSPTEVETLEAELAMAEAELARFESAKDMCNVFGVPINCSLCAKLDSLVDIEAELTEARNIVASKLKFLNNWNDALAAGDFTFLRSLAICIQNISRTKTVMMTRDIIALARRGDVSSVEAITHVVLGNGGVLDVNLLINTLLPNVRYEGDGTLTALQSLMDELDYDVDGYFHRNVPNLTGYQILDLNKINTTMVVAPEVGDALLTSADRQLSAVLYDMF